MKIRVIVVGVALLVSQSSFALDLLNSLNPVFIFKLSTNLQEVKKDARFKNCKDMGERNIESDESEPGLRYFKCTRFEDVQLLHLVFFNDILMTVKADFTSEGSPTFIKELFDLATETSGNIETRETALEKVLRDKCQAIKKIPVTRNQNIPLNGTSMKLSESLELYKTEQYRCVYVKYSVDMSEVFKERTHTYTKVQAFILMDEVLAAKSFIFAKEAKQKKLKRAAAKFKF
ncbi:MAG: hypothetical protein ACXVA2_15890 [Mucilaginibacter sp.]